MKKTIYRTVFRFEVLSEEPIDTNTAFHDIVTETIMGNTSGNIQIMKENQPVSGKAAVKLVENQGTDLEFFNMDLLGNEIIEEDENLALD